MIYKKTSMSHPVPLATSYDSEIECVPLYEITS